LGLRKIFIFSVFSGFSFAFSYRTSGDTSDVGFTLDLLNQLSQTGDSQTQALIMVLSIIVTVFFIYSLARFIGQIYEQRLAGIIIAVLGFSGSFLILSSSQQQTIFIVFGTILWITGIVVAILLKKHQSIVN